MPDGKRIPPDYGRIDATSEFRSELDRALNKLYPIVKDQNDEQFKGFKARKLPHCSFAINANRPSTLNRAMLMLSLSHSASTEDIAYSHHGARHETFNESSSKILEALENDQQELHWHIISRTVDTSSEKLEVGFRRLVINSPPYTRTSFQPAPHFAAIELKQKIKGGGALDKEIRKVTLKNGTAFGLLLGFYLGLEQHEIFKTFDNQQFSNNLKAKFSTSKTLTANRPEDRILLRDLERILIIVSEEGIHPSFSSDSYRKALETLTNYGWLKSGETDDAERFGFKSRSTKAQARAVLIELNEPAQKLANPNFVNPVRTHFIEERYGNLTTSEVRTAFLVID